MSSISQRVQDLRQQHYNAQVLRCIDIHPELRILRIVPREKFSFQPGQFTVLGLGGWEHCVEGTICEIPPQDGKPPRLIRRAYSFSCSMLDDSARLLEPNAFPYVEFYIALVRGTQSRPAALTPRLFDLREGDGLFVGAKVSGRYTLHNTSPDQDVVFVATGTGEAPHNAMLSQLLSGGHRGRIVSVSCVRYKRDLAYAAVHQELQRRYPGYCYRGLTTREPENLDSSLPDFVGKQYVQEYVTKGGLERDLGRKVDPARTHFFLCGNPAMIGIPTPKQRSAGEYPRPTGMVEILERLGFQTDEPDRPGNLHFEKYW